MPVANARDVALTVKAFRFLARRWACDGCRERHAWGLIVTHAIGHPCEWQEVWLLENDDWTGEAPEVRQAIHLRAVYLRERLEVEANA